MNEWLSLWGGYLNVIDMSIYRHFSTLNHVWNKTILLHSFGSQTFWQNGRSAFAHNLSRVIFSHMFIYCFTVRALSAHLQLLCVTTPAVRLYLDSLGAFPTITGTWYFHTIGRSPQAPVCCREAQNQHFTSGKRGG